MVITSITQWIGLLEENLKRKPMVFTIKLIGVSG